MNHQPTRRPLTVTLDEALVRRAEELGLALDAEIEAALAQRLARAEEDRARAEMIALLNERAEAHEAFAREHSVL